uniref:ARL14 effector protein-like n=1 Tax=Phallusia mammillata TaxID=59560 RepID=A0A6F9D7D5_9ASCI|nr:ARL14 effector protein-like [Phallusia mammillata]
MAKTDKQEQDIDETNTPVIKSLQFVNPGPALEQFNPENSVRQERKLRRMIQQATKMKTTKKTLYDDGGHLSVDGRDICDCLREKCPGCFYPCEKCRSTKCGKECRCLRKWHYTSTEVEGGESRMFPFKDP